MKTIIAGSRTITRIADVIDAIHGCGWENEITEVFCGMAEGVDLNGKWIAEKILNLYVEEFPAKWQTFGRSAGPMRNATMAKYADALILVWDGKSKGSANMLKHAQDRGLRIHQHILNEYGSRQFQIWGSKPYHD